jgi:hypothetical protein
MMPVERIERIINGAVVQRAEPAPNGLYACLPSGANMRPVLLSTLDEVADYLRANPGSGVRMNPGWSKISKRVFIDGLPR